MLQSSSGGCLPGRGGLPGPGGGFSVWSVGGLPGPGGFSLPGGVSAMSRGGVCLVLGGPAWRPPPWTESQTCVKT